MTVEAFNNYSELEKHQVVFDAEKVDEVKDGFITYALFRLHNLFVEVRTSPSRQFRRSFRAYELKDLPMIFAGRIIDKLAR